MGANTGVLWELSWGAGDLGQALVQPCPDHEGERSVVVVLLLEEVQVLVITSELAG